MGFPPDMDAAQWASLTGRLALVQADADSPGLLADELFDPVRSTAFLDELGPQIGSPSRAVTASMLGKRHSFLATGASLYAMSVHNRAFDMSPGNVRVDPTHDGKLWRSRLLLQDLHTCPAPDDAQARHAWRDAMIAQLFGAHLAPLWRTLCAVSKLAPRILWENMAVRVYSLYENRMPGDATPAQRTRIAEDFSYLVGDAPGALFGLDHNPLARYFFPVTPVAGDEDGIRYRKTCCLYDKLPSGELCSACPLMRKKR